MLLSQQTTVEGYDLRKSESTKRRNLQGLRGIAILFVLLMHLRPNFYRLGFIGVDIFFVLSGYLMAKMLLRKNFTMDSVFVFYCRRFKRIVPLYMVTVLSIYMYGYFYVFRIDRKQILDDLAWACTYTSNLQPIFQKLGYWDQLSTYRFFVHFWSLGVELQYYFIVPLFMGIASCCKQNIRLVFFFSLIASSAFFQLYSPPNISYGFLLSRIWQFMCGSVAYELSRQDSPDAVLKYNLDRAYEKNLLIKSLVTYIWLVALFVAVVISPKRISDDTARVCATFMAGIIIYLNANVFCLTNSYIVYCGDISYVLYLVHWPIIVAVRYCWDSQTLSVTEIEYAIEWNIRESSRSIDLPCGEDDTEGYAKFSGGYQSRCVARGNGTANIMLIGNSVAERAYPLLHDILKGRYRTFRLFSRNTCPALSNWCPTFSEAMRKVVCHERPDILLSTHHSLIGPFVEPIKNLTTDLVYNQYQSNVNFISNYTKYIVIDMPYYKYRNFNTGATLVRRLKHGLLLGDELIVTWQQYMRQTQHHRKRISSLVCSKCIINDVSEGLFYGGTFFTYDPITFLARTIDGSHLTPIGLELLRPSYTRIIDELLEKLGT